MKTETNNPSWLVPPTPTSELHAKPAQESMPSNPSWLISPHQKPQPSIAKTTPIPVLSIRLQIDGRKPTKEEWAMLQAALKEHPERRLSIGTKHPSLPNLIFLRYHVRYPNGEMWGTKEQLVEAREKRRANVKKWRQGKAKHDPEWKAERDTKLKELAERQKIRLAASKEAAEEARYGNSRRAKAYRRRRSEREAADALAKEERLRKRREARAKLPKVIP